MTKDEIRADVDALIKSLEDTSPFGKVYNDGFMDGANYVLGKLQQLNYWSGEAEQCVIHSTDFLGKCFKCNKQVFNRTIKPE